MLAGWGEGSNGYPCLYMCDTIRTIEDNLPFRRSMTASELSISTRDDHQSSVAVTSGVTTSDLTPVSGSEGSITTK